MKKVILSTFLIVIVALSILLVGCTTEKSISTDMGFKADSIAELSVSRSGVTKSTKRFSKIEPAFNLINEIQFDEYDGQVLDSDKTDVPDYSIKITLKGYEGAFQLSVIVKDAGSIGNASDKDVLLVWFAPTDDFNYKNVIDGFYTVADSAAVLAALEKIDTDIMSFGA